MGLEQTVAFAGPVPAWRDVQELLARHGAPVQIRMIDGETESWRELRVSSTAGMVTLRSGPDRVTLVTWGNAETPLLRVRNALAWAFAEAGAGRIDCGEGEQDAIGFRKTADLPAESVADREALQLRLGIHRSSPEA